ncbi:MAG: TetR/AcrR family transcriptional regulator [Mycobacteriales bacterium]
MSVPLWANAGPGSEVDRQYILGVDSVKTSRPYSTSIRRGDARPAILSAAARLFATGGYHATSIDAISREAGVARPTVFTAVGTKAEILKLVVEEAMAGDEAPVAIKDRRWFQEVLACDDPDRLLTLHARNMTAILSRVSDLYCAVENAAASDPEVGALWADLQRQRLEGQQVVAHALGRATNLRAAYDSNAVADILWGIATPASYRRLVTERGWSPNRYQAWLTDMLHRTFLND